MIECTKFKSHVKGFLQGFADLYIPEWKLEIKNCTLHMKNGRRWLSMPAKEFENDSGEKKFYPLVQFRHKVYMDAFSDAAKKAIDKWCKENSQNDEEKSLPDCAV